MFGALRSTAIASQRQLINEQLRTFQRNVVDPRLSFDPDSATLVFEQEDIRGKASLLQTHRINRNPHGAYFLFIATAYEPPYFTHLSRERAMDALRLDPEAFRREFPDAADS
jgi:hypothetical protein